MDLYPLKFKPIYKEKIWGDKRLARIFHRKLPGQKIGESWEIAAHSAGLSIVSNGPLKGESLSELTRKYPEQLLGSFGNLSSVNTFFPLLVKFLDVEQPLSVQVHPDDNYKKMAEGESGKTEVWYIIDAEKGAGLIYGLKPETEKEELRTAISEGRIADYLNKIKVKKGEVYFLPAGTVHAIMGGVLIAEIQQNSDTTYRLYDWDRRDKKGQKRPLHIKKALDVINYQQANPVSDPLFIKGSDYRKKYLVCCPYFVLELIELDGKYSISPAGERFYILINLRGEGELIYRSMKIKIGPGQIFLLPAGLAEVKINGRLEFLTAYLPPSRDILQLQLRKDGFSEEKISRFISSL
ncbi:MAG TPA: type I phosphomannose isomerase catalytic subunit [Halanaerobiales bacterium]|nr:type I phosphomannose isomerase catalytic subunit [Halanaerobiales bacterium]